MTSHSHNRITTPNQQDRPLAGSEIDVQEPERMYPDYEVASVHGRSPQFMGSVHFGDESADVYAVVLEGRTHPAPESIVIKYGPKENDSRIEELDTVPQTWADIKVDEINGKIDKPASMYVQNGQRWDRVESPEPTHNALFLEAIELAVEQGIVDKDELDKSFGAKHIARVIDHEKRAAMLESYLAKFPDIGELESGVSAYSGDSRQKVQLRFDKELMKQVSLGHVPDVGAIDASRKRVAEYVQRDPAKLDYVLSL